MTNILEFKENQLACNQVSTLCYDLSKYMFNVNY